MMPLALPPSPPAALFQPVAVTRVAARPLMEVWQVDQLRLPLQTPPATLAALGPDHSLAAVIVRLKAMGVPFTRTRAGLLPDRMPPALRAQIDGLPAGEPFVLPEADYISVNVVVGRILPPGTVRWTPPSPRPAPLQEA